MYVTRIKNRGYTPTILLRESYRENGKVKSRTLANLTDWPPKKIEALRSVLKMKKSGRGDIPGGFVIKRSLPYGHAAAVVGAMRKLGLDKVICSRRSRQRDLVMAMVAERVLQPASKASTAASLDAETRQTALAQVLQLGDEVTPDDLYEAMDWLERRQPYIEKKLAARHLEEGAMAMFDLTSTWVEGSKCELARYGYSRDGKRGKRQIEFTLLADAEGRPIAVQAFEGNVADPATVSSTIARLRDRFGLQHVVLVGDRGMLTGARIREEVAPLEGLEFITGLRKPTIRKLLNTGDIQLSLFDEQDLAVVTSDEFPGERLVVCRNPLQADEQDQRRSSRITRGITELARVQDAIRRDDRPLRGVEKIAMRVGKVFGKVRGSKKYFDVTISNDSMEFDILRDVVEADARLDGLYVVRTDVAEDDLDAPAVVRAYKQLWEVENDFRSFKTVDLNVRPIFHRLTRRVKAHLLICMLALYVKREMQNQLAPLLFVDEQPEAGEALRDSVVSPAQRSEAALAKAACRRTADGEYPIQSFRVLLRHLGTMTTNHVVPEDAVTDGFWMPSKPTPIQKRAFELLGVDPNQP